MIPAAGQERMANNIKTIGDIEVAYDAQANVSSNEVR